MLKYRTRNKSNKSSRKNKTGKSKTKTKSSETNNNESDKIRKTMKTTNQSLKQNLSNTSSSNSSLSKNKKTQNKENKNIEQEIKKEKSIDEELIKQQSKILKDFLTPILKEQTAKELVSVYNKMEKYEKKLNKKNKFTSLKNKPILEYSFVTGSSRNKIKIPLFQILTPNQYKIHKEKKNKEKLNTLTRCYKNSSTTNIINRNTNNKISIMSMSGQNNKFNNNDSIKIKENDNNQKNKNEKLKINSSILNNDNKPQMTKNIENASNQINNNINTKSQNRNIKIKRAKTPPLYLRINEVKQKHNEEIEKLREKYEYNYKKNNKKNLQKDDNDSYSSFDLSNNISSNITSNKSQLQNDFERWYNYEKTWQKMKEMKLSIIKSEIEENKICQNIYNRQQETFKPKINKNSENLLLRKYDGDFYERLKNYQVNKERQTEMLKKRLKPKFKPYVNGNYNINKEYYLYMKYDQKKINKDLKLFS